MVKNPKSFNFKNTLNNDPQKYTVANANAFGLNGFVSYKKQVVHISRTSLDMAELTTKLDTTDTVNTVFLKAIVTGNKVSLYNYTDEIRSRYYVFVNESGQISELKYYKYVEKTLDKNDASANKVITVNTYRAQLMQQAAIYQPENKNLASQIPWSTNPNVIN